MAAKVRIFLGISPLIISCLLTIHTAAAQSTYCAARGLDTSYESITSVKFDDDFRGGRATGYLDYTNQKPVALVTSTTISLELAPFFKQGAYNEHWAIYIDTNRNGAFELTENVFQGRSIGKTVLNGTFTLPGNVSVGATRGRVIMSYEAITSPCRDVRYGAVLDIAVEIEQRMPDMLLSVNSARSSDGLYLVDGNRSKLMFPISPAINSGTNVSDLASMDTGAVAFIKYIQDTWSTAVVSFFEPKLNTAVDIKFSNWDRINKSFAGGIVACGSSVLVAGKRVPNQGRESGALFRYDFITNRSESFDSMIYSDLALGLDSKLYGLQSTNRVDIIDPVSAKKIKTVTLQIPDPAKAAFSSAAVDQLGNIYLVWSPTTNRDRPQLFKYNQHGVLRKSVVLEYSGILPPTELQINSAGMLAVASYKEISFYDRKLNRVGAQVKMPYGTQSAYISYVGRQATCKKISPCQNQADIFDINNDVRVDEDDRKLLHDFLRTGSKPVGEISCPAYLDVNNDDWITPMDLVVWDNNSRDFD